MYVPMPITDIALPLRHGMLYKKSVASVTKMLDHYTLTVFDFNKNAKQVYDKLGFVVDEVIGTLKLKYIMKKHR